MRVICESARHRFGEMKIALILCVRQIDLIWLQRATGIYIYILLYECMNKCV